LRPEQLEYLRNLRYVTQVQSFTLVHSTLDNPEMWGYVFDKFEAEANFNYQCSAVCFFGHTHVPLAFQKAVEVRGGLYDKIKVAPGWRYFINVGSVGQPRDRDRRAAYVLYDLQAGEIVLRRVPYDVEAAKRKILEAELPPALAERLSDGR
jgi:diadenosine tetraphosphatase ApaH/serine/threonine PP2A family protein phosphatase